MTNAKQGLRLTPQRSDNARDEAGNEAVPLAGMSAEEIVAQMSDEQKAAVTAALAPKASDAGPHEGGSEAAEPEPEDKDSEKPVEQSSFDAGFQAATARMAAVFASDEFAGRETKAAKLLGNAKLSADEIVGLLADEAKSDGAKMLDKMTEGGNANLGTGGGAETTQKSADIWDKAIKANNPTKRPA